MNRLVHVGRKLFLKTSVTAPKELSSGTITTISQSWALRCRYHSTQRANNDQAQTHYDKPDKEQALYWWEEATVYVHWPYCKKRCTYCNFNKYITSAIDQERMAACLVTEAQSLIKLSGVTRVDSIFFGGGTPSLAEPGVIGAVVDAVRGSVVMPTDAEITLEANPTSVEMKKLEEFKSAGINRLSLGIQSLRQEDLKLLGRDHTVDQSLSCIQEAKRLFPGRLSIDVIFGRPSQQLVTWEAELDEILDICDDHISLYQLTLEPGTPLFKWNKEGALPMPDEDAMAEMYEMAVRKLAQAGFYRYEVSNFARNEHAESMHNKAYWEGKQYIGVGPGAHGRFCPMAEPRGHPRPAEPCQNSMKQSGYVPLTQHSRKFPEEIELCEDTLGGYPWELYVHSCVRVNSRGRHLPEPQREARIQTLEPEAWKKEVDKYGHATRKRVVQSRSDLARELLLTGLRTRKGIQSKTWSRHQPDASLEELFGASDFVREAVTRGLLDLDESGIRCTEQGLNMLDSLMPELVHVLDSYFEQVNTC